MPDDPLHNRQIRKVRRRELRNNATPAESALWRLLQKRQLAGRKFRRQHGIGPYIVDFYCPSEKLAVELDGEPHFNALRQAYDAERTAFMQSQGIRTVRFENRMVFEHPDQIGEAIAWHFNRDVENMEALPLGKGRAVQFSCKTYVSSTLPPRAFPPPRPSPGLSQIRVSDAERRGRQAKPVEDSLSERSETK